MLLCEVSCCEQPAVALIHFKMLAKPHAFCSMHAFNRRGEPIFGRSVNGAWISPVRHVERIRSPKEAP